MAEPIRVLVTDPLAEEGIRLLQDSNRDSEITSGAASSSRSRISVDVKTKLSPEQLKETIGQYDGLVVRSGTQVTGEVLGHAKKLKVIGRAGAGLDNIDLETASKLGVVVMNAAGGNTVSTAEHTMSMILSLARRIPQACASLKSGEWDRSSFRGVELYGKTLGIIGMGRIGSEVAKRALSFGMRLLVYDPFLSEERVRELEAAPVASMEEVLRKSDFITVHTPLSEETKGLIGDKEIALMKKGVRIINCARGGIVEEKALAEAIRSGHVAGAALDVFEKEPPPASSELLNLPQVVVTPHLGGSTEEAQSSVAREIAVSVRDYLLGRGIRNAVNVPSVDAEMLKLIEPYLRLIERLGALQAQLVEGRVKEVRIRYIGEMIRWDVAPLTIAFVKGLLTPALQETVNYVNAAVIAKERGIKVIESKASEGADFANLIDTVVETDQGEARVQGTLFTRTDPRIVRINDFRVEAVPAGSMLLVKNQDSPGMIGRVGTALGERGINIGFMTFGRKTEGGEALLLLNLDQAPSAEDLAQIRKLPRVLEVKLIKL